MRYIRVLWALLVVTGCATVNDGGSGYHLVGVDGVYTLANLHSVMRFTIVKTGDQYSYRRHNIMTKPQQFPAHLDKYFGTRCVKEEVAELSEVDRNGIAQG